MEESTIIPEEIQEKCVLVGVINSAITEEQANEYLDELEFLAETAGAVTMRKFLQKLPFPNPKTFVGTGKIEEVRTYMKDHEIELVIFDDELSPSQLRNIERILECKVLDRNILILDIFASRARSSHAKTQVELAQLQYMLPRLTRMWTHLERQKGGIGLRGPGESQIETDRRIIQMRIALMKEKLKDIDKQMAIQRGNRGQLVRVALVGYTNVGKSTLMNLLSKSDVFAENKLFATLDTTVRKVVIENLPFLLTDTVGFIRKLPHQLVESFKSTLDEVREADLLIHVLDISHSGFEDQYHVVNETLAEITALDESHGKEKVEKPVILVFNKIDAYVGESESEILYRKLSGEGGSAVPDGRQESESESESAVPPPSADKFGRQESEELGEGNSLEELKKTWMSKMNNTQCVFISAQDKENIEELKSVIYEEVKRIFQIRYPYHHFLF